MGSAARNLAHGLGVAGVTALRPPVPGHDGGLSPRRHAGATRDAQVVEETGPGNVPGDLLEIPGAEAALDELVAGDPHADDEARPDDATDRGQHLEAEAHAVLEAPAVAVAPPVGERRPELVRQVIGEGDDVDTIRAGFLDSERRVGVARHDLGDLVLAERARILATHGLGDC